MISASITVNDITYRSPPSITANRITETRNTANRQAKQPSVAQNPILNSYVHCRNELQQQTTLLKELVIATPPSI